MRFVFPDSNDEETLGSMAYDAQTQSFRGAEETPYGLAVRQAWRSEF